MSSPKKIFGTDGVRGTANIEPVTAETALRLGRYFGNAPQFWINLQAQYDLAVAMRDVGPLVEREVQTAA